LGEFKDNTLQCKLTNDRTRQYEHVLRANKERILKKVSNMKLNGKCSKGRTTSRWEQQVRKEVTQKREETEEEEL
jgi:hypothetical protein